MSHDIIADALNNVMNAKKSHKTEVTAKWNSKLLGNVLEIAKKSDYIDSFKIDGKIVTIKIGELNKCGAIKPRHNIQASEIEKFMRECISAFYGMTQDTFLATVKVIKK